MKSVFKGVEATVIPAALGSGAACNLAVADNAQWRGANDLPVVPAPAVQAKQIADWTPAPWPPQNTSPQPATGEYFGPAMIINGMRF